MALHPDLIDGERLCDLLREHKLGVRTTVRQVEDVEVRTGVLLRSVGPVVRVGAMMPCRDRRKDSSPRAGARSSR
jgi:hypothetical protein